MREFILILLALLSVLPTAISVGAQEKVVVGWIEKVRIYPGDLLMKAKLDTGATNSSLNTPSINEFDRNGERWVRFDVIGGDGKKVTLERKIQRVARIKRKAAGSQERPVVILGICLGNHFKEVEVNLVDRSNFLYPILIGRSYMAGDLIVDPSSKYVTTPNCKEGIQP